MPAQPLGSGLISVNADCTNQQYDGETVPSMLSNEGNITVNGKKWTADKGYRPEYINSLCIDGKEVRPGQHVVAIGRCIVIVDDPELLTKNGHFSAVQQETRQSEPWFFDEPVPARDPSRDEAMYEGLHRAGLMPHRRTDEWADAARYQQMPRQSITREQADVIRGYANRLHEARSRQELPSRAPSSLEERSLPDTCPVGTRAISNLHIEYVMTGGGWRECRTSSR